MSLLSCRPAFAFVCALGIAPIVAAQGDTIVTKDTLPATSTLVAPVAPATAAATENASRQKSAASRIPGMALAAVGVAGMQLALGEPKGWSRTWGGYARRVGDQAGFIAIEETVRLSLGATVDWTPDTQPCGGRASKAKWRALLPRVGCAMRETALLRTSDAHARPNFPLVLGAVTASAVSTTWRPDASTPSKAVSLALTRTAIVLGSTVVSHLISDWRSDRQ
jgi:hypothetical protein